MKIQFLGQAGFLITGNHSKILIDPYLSNYVVTGGYGSTEMFSRNFPPPVNPEELTGIDAVFITHDHADHCDLDTMQAIHNNTPNTVFIGPKPVRDHLLSIKGFKATRVISLRNGREVSGGVEYLCIPAAHPYFEVGMDARDSECVGFLIRLDNIVIYHSGDTVLYDSLVENILSPKWPIDIACLPVNGRDEKREKLGIIGNLNALEAIALAVSIKARMMIPMHNDLFTINQDDPEKVKAVLEKEHRISIKQIKAGESFTYEK